KITTGSPTVPMLLSGMFKPAIVHEMISGLDALAVCSQVDVKSSRVTKCSKRWAPIVRTREQVKTESGSAQDRIVARPNASPMGFDDRPANCQTYTHAAGFGREEAFKNTREMRRINTRAAVLDATAHRLGV